MFQHIRHPLSYLMEIGMPNTVRLYVMDFEIFIIEIKISVIRKIILKTHKNKQNKDNIDHIRISCLPVFSE